MRQATPRRAARPRFWQVGDAGKFHFSDYWQRWSLVVSVRVTDAGLLVVVEKDITGPEPGRIRTHGTELGKLDLLVDALPEGVLS
jgi:hypothetical protein